MLPQLCSTLYHRCSVVGCTALQQLARRFQGTSLYFLLPGCILKTRRVALTLRKLVHHPLLHYLTNSVPKNGSVAAVPSSSFVVLTIVVVVVVDAYFAVIWYRIQTSFCMLDVEDHLLDWITMTSEIRSRMWWPLPITINIVKSSLFCSNIDHVVMVHTRRRAGYCSHIAQGGIGPRPLSSYLANRHHLPM